MEYFWDLETNSTPSKRKDQKSLLENQEEYIKKSNLIFYVEPQALNTIMVAKGYADSGTYITEEGQKEILLQMLQPVSYTHLDVYKRQEADRQSKELTSQRLDL